MIRARALMSGCVVAAALDFRGYGTSGGARDIAHIDRDTLGAIAYARSQGATVINLVGASMMGGTASLVAAAEAPDTDSHGTHLLDDPTARRPSTPRWRHCSPLEADSRLAPLRR